MSREKQPCLIRAESGFSLMELLIVVCIIGVVGAIAGMLYSTVMDRYNVEREMRELQADLLQARQNAMMKNRFYFVTLTASQYTIYEDTSPSPDGDGTLQPASDTQRLRKSLKSRYPITWNGSSATMNFNTRGIWDSSNDSVATKTICSNADISADNNCIVLISTRINLGRLSTTVPKGGACDAANCFLR